MSEMLIQQRRDLARKAFESCPIGEHDCTSCSRDRCIEAATRVTITDEPIQILLDAGLARWRQEAEETIRTVCYALGFEVTT